MLDILKVYFRDWADLIIAPLDGVEFFLHKRDYFQPSKGGIRCEIGLHHPINLLTKIIVEPSHEKKWNPGAQLAELFALGFYA